MRNIVGISTFLFFLVFSSMASALVISNVEVSTLRPGEEGYLFVTVENNADDSIQEVTFSLDLSNLPITTVGSSEDSIYEIEDDDTDKFSFILKAFTSAKPGDYKIPYTLTYKDSSSVKKGTIGVKISAPVELDFSYLIDKPVIGQKATLNLKVINKGQADARYASLEIVPDGFILLSEERLYIGTISSDDFETASFEILLTSNNPVLIGNLKYLDSENNPKTQAIDIPLTVYSREKAIELGIIKKNNTLLYIIVLVIFILFWISMRYYKKRKRAKKSLDSFNGR